MGFMCTMPTVWPDRAASDPRDKKLPVHPLCWMEFPTEIERMEHQYYVHALFMQELRDGAVWRERCEAMIERNTGKAPFDPLAYEPPFGSERPDDDGMFSDGRTRPNGATGEQVLELAALSKAKGRPTVGVTTGVEAFEKIEQLNLLPDLADLPAPPDPTSNRNQYKTQCDFCGHAVAPKQGAITRDAQAGRWVVVHFVCPRV